jgi:hypothetical protein
VLSEIARAEELMMACFARITKALQMTLARKSSCTHAMVARGAISALQGAAILLAFLQRKRHVRDGAKSLRYPLWLWPLGHVREKA